MNMQVDESDESRYHHLLSTNNQASNEDAIELQKVIALREAAPAELIAEVVDVSPVRRLTREILVKIFLFTRHWEGDPNWVDKHLKPLPVGPRPGTSPLIITHICSYWRKVALGEPTLWATILSRRKPYHPSLRSTDPFRDFRLLTWLARSGPTMPLDITVEVWPYFGGGPTPLVWLKPYMHRIRTLSLLGEFNRLPKGSFELLEMLRMGSVRVYDPASAISAPSLRRVCFRGDMFQPPTIIPWRQLTHLSIAANTPRERILYEVFLKCCALKYLDMSTAYLGIISDSDTDMAEMECIPGYFFYLTAPALTILRTAYFEFPIVEYLDFRDRSSFCLKSLALSGKRYQWRPPNTADYEILSFIIHASPSLEEVVLHNLFFITPTLLSVLTSNSTDGVLDIGPNLQYFAVSLSSGRADPEKYERAVHDELVLDMIMARDPSGKPGTVEPNLPPNTRIIRSHTPKRFACIGELTDFRLDEIGRMGSIMGMALVEAMHIYFYPSIAA
ncbi:hypothetical protein Hypma_004108 [Hypsizygus marmoreus]|uniref:F-box domain-containing protein n=1 Tax=Hypsizygus marmoreus TaxID=39966 RepID=A0A369K6K2_HYPMA|nr:hypothetical protein Hypma_004108 [Hypsizygus marmoreus]